MLSAVVPTCLTAATNVGPARGPGAEFRRCAPSLFVPCAQLTESRRRRQPCAAASARPLPHSP